MPRPRSKERAAEARKRFAAGEKCSSLAKSYGVEVSTVYRWVGGINKKYGSGAKY